MSTWVFRAAIGIWLLGRELAIDCNLETSTAHQARRVQAQKRLTWNLGTCQVVLTNLVYVFESFFEAAAGPAASCRILLSFSSCPPQTCLNPESGGTDLISAFFGTRSATMKVRELCTFQRFERNSLHQSSHRQPN